MTEHVLSVVIDGADLLEREANRGHWKKWRDAQRKDSA